MYTRIHGRGTAARRFLLVYHVWLAIPQSGPCRQSRSYRGGPSASQGAPRAPPPRVGVGCRSSRLRKEAGHITKRPKLGAFSCNRSALCHKFVAESDCSQVSRLGNTGQSGRWQPKVKR